MPEATRTFTVTTAPDVVLDYLKDFSHAEEWDPGTKRCVRNGSGPVEVGSTWHNTSEFLGSTTELTYTLKELSDDQLVFVGENDSATSVDTISVRPSDGGSEITYHADITFKGVAKLAAPVASIALHKLGNDTEKQMTEVLNGLTGQPAG